MRRLEMVAVDFLEFAVVDAVGGVIRLRPGDEPLMKVGALALQQPVVGRVAHQEVLESVGAVAFAVRARLHKLLAGEGAEIGRHPRRHRRGHEIDNRRNGEVLADHRSGLDDVTLLGIEQVQTSREQRVDRGRHLERRDIADLHPLFAVAAKGPIVNEHRE